MLVKWKNYLLQTVQYVFKLLISEFSFFCFCKLPVKNLSNISNALEKISQTCISVLDRLVLWTKNEIDVTSTFHQQTFDPGIHENKSPVKEISKNYIWNQQTSLFQESQLLFISFEKTYKQSYTYLNEKDDSDNKKNSGRLLSLFFLTNHISII